MSLILCMVIGGVLVSDLENSMVSIAHGVVKSQTRLTDFSLHFTSQYLHEAVLVSAVQQSELVIHIPTLF